MNNHRMKRLLGLMATLLVSAMLAACGGDDGGDGGGGGGPLDQNPPSTSGGGGSSGGGPTDQPANKDEAIDRCYEEAKKLEGQARETAEAGCKAADTGDTDELKDQAKEQCLDSTKQIPDEAARKQAEESCEMIGN